MISLVVIATGPERLVARSLETAMRQTTAVAELIVVHDGGEDAAQRRLSALGVRRPARLIPAGTMSQGAARNAAVRASRGSFFLVIDGSERLPADHAAAALRTLEEGSDVAFAAAPGASLFGITCARHARAGRIDAAALVGGAWSVGPAIIRREAFDRVGGFDESLPALVDWDLLLTLADAGHNGAWLHSAGSRDAGDDVRLRQALRSASYLPAMRTIVTRHRQTFEAHARRALIDRERTLKTLFDHERPLLARRSEIARELRAAKDQIAAIRPELARYGLRTLELADLRRTSPISRNWGIDRGVPVDRHYIHEFLNAHADDVRGHVLEMLDDGMTVAYGGSRVERCDVVDIDPGNARADLIADLRVPEQLPADVYDCVVLTQTLHLIDDMPAALRSACRLLKPGGILLATLPCASMVATEYGARGDHWRLTEAGARALFEGVFNPADLSIRARGNVLTTTAFLYGLCCDDLDPGEFAVDDPAYPLLVSVRARKPAATTRLARPETRRAAAVLLYHRVANVPNDPYGLAVSATALRAQVEHLLLDGWRILPLQTLIDAVTIGDPPERALALTFDDGYVDNLDAATVLGELGVPATFFLTSERRDEPGRFWWDVLEDALLSNAEGRGEIVMQFGHERRRLETGTATARRAAHDELYHVLKGCPPVVRDDLLRQLARQTSVALLSDTSRPMLAAEIRRLAAFPLADVGAHGVHHRALSQLSAEDCHREIFESRSALERLIGRPVTTFAYPFGDVTRDAVSAVAAADFRCALTCDARGLRAREHPLRIPRLPTRNESAVELTARLRQLFDATPHNARC